MFVILCMFTLTLINLQYPNNLRSLNFITPWHLKWFDIIEDVGLISGIEFSN